MFVSDWMTKNVYTVSIENSVSHAIKLMKDNNVKHIPVMEGTKLVGLISDRDIKEFAPSKATTLDIMVLHYRAYSHLMRV